MVLLFDQLTFSSSQALCTEPNDSMVIALGELYQRKFVNDVLQCRLFSDVTPQYIRDDDNTRLTDIFQDNPCESSFWILLELRTKDDGGDNWSYKTCKAPVKQSPPTDQHPAFYRRDALSVTQPTVSERCKHCTLAVVRRSQKFSSRYRPPFQGRRTAKI